MLCRSPRQILAFTTLTLALTIVLRAATITLTPSNPTVLLGQTLQLTANGAVVPVSIGTGLWHTCVLYSDQTVRCAGLNNQGELGNGNTTRQFEPALANTTNAVAIRNGNEHTCSLVGDGRMQCFGTNFTGQIGTGVMGNFYSTPQFVQNITTAVKSIAGGYHTCAILPDSTVQCWGRNQDGQLGNGDATTDTSLPGAVQNLGAVADLVTGSYHNCALMPDHTAMCWGRNGRGQVGDGTYNSPITLPHQVVGLSNAVMLNLGGFHSCALMQDATVKCWGQGDQMQLGVPGLAASNTPVTVTGLSNVTGLYQGFLHTCAQVSGGTVWCWGQNDFGQLGNGATGNTATPVQMQGILNPIYVVGGIGHTCALTQDRFVKCVGENDFGELGDGTGVNALAPVNMHFTGSSWTSSNPSAATVSVTGLVTAVATGSTTITMTDSFGNTGTTTIDVIQMQNLSVINQGDGNGTVTSSPAGISCAPTCSASFVGGSSVTLTAAAGVDSNFTGWTGCDSVSGATCTVTMSGARNVTAIFMLKRFTLSTAKAGNGGGTITSSPSGINCGTACASDYVINTVVTLTATPNADSNFTSWSGCDSVNAATCTVAMTAVKSATATFTLKTFPLTVSKAGDGIGTVTSNPAGVNCGTDCSEIYIINTSVTLTAAPDADSNFTGWTGCDSVNGATCTVSMTAAKSVTATFALKTFLLTVSKTGIGTGTVTSSPAGINCGSDCTELYIIHTTVTLTATPGIASVLTGWTGCDSVNGNNQCIVSMHNAKQVSADFLGLPIN
jgi:alpha-tubulin suppressor-like RCC1 family protein